ncbi:hypothetical protein HPB48_012624 [Haemaphysalis longicornis]|uniref:Nucleic-acid-binding protein from transposon X-element n=1 Tax=Haemaphysalis longicornis TaxID=44386 RepID=A0A9J6FQG8_HAELO|nr:hypothetical protein HPB48_012624 [Haemaphysalis longicornis]
MRNTRNTGHSANDLKQHLRCSAAEIITARPLGKTNSALVTFNAPSLPRIVRLFSVVTRVFPYKPRTLVCDTCHQMGHKKDICPNHTAPKCSTCGLAAVENHQCATTPSCTNCKGAHRATDPTCPARKQAQDAKCKRLKHHAQIGHKMPPCPNFSLVPSFSSNEFPPLPCQQASPSTGSHVPSIRDQLKNSQPAPAAQPILSNFESLKQEIFASLQTSLVAAIKEQVISIMQ